MVRSIVTVPDPILATPSRDVADPQSRAVQELIRDMKETVVAASGIGLAAPQVGVSLRVIVVNHLRDPYGLINPTAVWVSAATSVLEEGCLSIPDVIVPVRRPRNVRVAALDEQGNTVEIAADNLLAKILQHEIDHLNGVLITSYAGK